MTKRIVIGVLCSFVVFFVVFLGYLFFNRYKNPASSSGLFVEYLEKSSENPIEHMIGNIPENLQVRMITAVAPFYHGMFSKEEAAKTRTTLLPVYKEMQSKQDWSKLPSSLGNTYLSTIHLPPKQNQYFVYIPQKTEGQKIPAIVFLHGFGGNFTPYFYKLSSIADKYHVAIIAPSYKNGVWDDDSIAFVKSVTENANKKFDVDPNSYYLLGFSNGGLTAPKIYLNNSDSYKGLILISTYLDSEKLLKTESLSLLKKINILVIQGSNDHRVEVENTRSVVKALQTKNISVVLKEFPTDHFVFFENNTEVEDLIGKTYFEEKQQ